MKYADRNGIRREDNSGQDRFLKALYTNVVGRAFLKILTCETVSKIGGALLNTGVSSLFVKSFVKKNNIDLSLYEKNKFDSYNDFFTRTIKAENRPVNMDENIFISPCDSKLTAFEINSDSYFNIKNTRYNVASLLRDKKLAKKYEGGIGLLFRLTVDDYHHYCYVDSGVKTSNRKIKGVLHTVNPIANDLYPIYKENSREYCMLRTENFGDVVCVEIGALMVGKITNLQGKGAVKKGAEKGYFEFGGSSVMVLVEKDKVVLDEDIVKNSADGYETIVKMGEGIGRKLS